MVRNGLKTKKYYQNRHDFKLGQKRTAQVSVMREKIGNAIQ